MKFSENIIWLLFYFVFARSLRSALIKGGGWDKIMDFAVGKDEQVKFKFFAMLINFKTCCFRGGETISKLP